MKRSNQHADEQISKRVCGDLDNYYQHLKFTTSYYDCSRTKCHSESVYETHVKICKLCMLSPYTHTFRRYNVVLPCGKFFTVISKSDCVKHFEKCSFCTKSYIEYITQKKDLGEQREDSVGVFFPMPLEKVLSNEMQSKKSVMISLKASLETFYKSYNERVTFENAHDPTLYWCTPRVRKLQLYKDNIVTLLAKIVADIPEVVDLEARIDNLENEVQKLIIMERSLMSHSMFHHKDNLTLKFTSIFRFSKGTEYNIDILSGLPQVHVTLSTSPLSMFNQDGMRNECCIEWKYPLCKTLDGIPVGPWMAFRTTCIFIIFVLLCFFPHGFLKYLCL